MTFDQRPYESGVLADGKGQALRPGGAELTARAVACGAWPPGARVIDIGCGCGPGLASLRKDGLDAVGIDISAPALRQARQKDGEVPLVQASGDALPFGDASAEGILAQCSLCLMPNPAAALAEFHRVLRPGGRLVITDLYARPSPPSFSATGFPGLVVREETVSRLEQAGFHLCRWEDHSQVLKICAARFIFEYGSLDALWGDTGRGPCCGEAMGRQAPGYALVVAQKGAPPLLEVGHG